MSASQSNLSSASYGYDLVVGTTQDSINSTLELFMSSLQEPEVTVCYIADSNGNPVAMDYVTFLKNSKGSDPFKIPASANPATDPDLKNLAGARFMMGFKAQIGLPAHILPSQLPDIVTLSGDASSVTYNLMCNNFTVVQYTPGSGYDPNDTWLSISQPATPTGQPWVFTSKVDMRLTTIDNTAYSTLSPAVQAQIKNMGSSAFSVQQLLFDLDNAALESVPTISGVTPGTPLYTLLETEFVGKYFSQMQANGKPILNAAIKSTTTPASSLAITDLNFLVSPYIGTPQVPLLTTLNYICSTNGDTLPPAVPFTWNWIDQADQANADGVIAVNRTRFLTYLNSLFSQQLWTLCLEPSCSFTHSGENMYTSWGCDGGVNSGQTFTVTAPGSATAADGFTDVLTFDFSKPSADNTFDSGHMFACNGQLNYNVSVKVAVNGSKIRITTISQAYFYFWYGGYDGGELDELDGTFVNYKNVVTYDLGVGQNGQIAATMEPAVFTDTSQTVDVSGWDKFSIGNIVGVMNTMQSEIGTATKTIMTNYAKEILTEFNTTRNWVFPGGNTFAFKDVTFSANQDLVSQITYTDPS